MRRWAAALILLALPGAPAALGADEPGAPRPRVVCTVGMITDLARRIAGEHAHVAGLMGEGVDPHLYKPTRTDIAALMGADVVFYNGLLLEGKMTDALVRVAGSGRRVVAVTEALDESFLLEPEGFDGHADPHVWMDPHAWAAAAQVIQRTLAQALPAHGGAIAEAGSRVAADIAALDAWAERTLATIPEDRRVLVTAHDAFNYFGRRYGLEVVGIQGLSTESEAGVRDIERIVAMLVERRVPAVFIESTVSDRNVKALIAGARARGHEVALGGSLYSDAMGAAGTSAGTYLGMIAHNVSTITRALGGRVDEPPPTPSAGAAATGAARP
ncbi:MAG: zinc ABC transporter substrate-binding protein [Phycisphaerales bacterium]|nr:zinc ABC transporter substrate-binding protein [Phycisphaerales bacterium]